MNDPKFNSIIKDLAYKNKISKSRNGRPVINIDINGVKTQYTPEDISAIILKRLKDNAEDYLQREIKQAVITISAYFTETQREATKLAREASGFKVLKIIN